jgi:acyl-CoA synthetase (NDP forming)
VAFSHWLPPAARQGAGPGCDREGGDPVGRRVALVGPGGVLSVLGTDLLRRSGLDVPSLGAATLARLEALRLPPGSSVRNPLDTPVGVMQARGGRAFGEILRLVAEAGEVDWFVVHVSIQNLFSFLGDPETALAGSVAGCLEVAAEFRDRARFALVLRTNGEPALEPVRARYRAEAAAREIPVFARLEDAAAAVRSFVRWAEHRDRAGRNR